MRQLYTILVVFAVFVAAAVAQQDGPYKVLKTARVGGEGGWDYIDTFGWSLVKPCPGGRKTTTWPGNDKSADCSVLPSRLQSFPRD
jgi:hypothetical protein